MEPTQLPDSYWGPLSSFASFPGNVPGAGHDPTHWYPRDGGEQGRGRDGRCTGPFSQSPCTRGTLDTSRAQHEPNRRLPCWDVGLTTRPVTAGLAGGTPLQDKGTKRGADSQAGSGRGKKAKTTDEVRRDTLSRSCRHRPTLMPRRPP
jgi:hypothetical protein